MEFFWERGLEEEERAREGTRDQSLDGVMLKNKAHRSDYKQLTLPLPLTLRLGQLCLLFHFLLLKNGLITNSSLMGSINGLCEDQQYRV